jgi:hypothetical protein
MRDAISVATSRGMQLESLVNKIEVTKSIADGDVDRRTAEPPPASTSSSTSPAAAPAEPVRSDDAASPPADAAPPADAPTFNCQSVITAVATAAFEDYTQIPVAMDQRFDAFDEEGAVRAVTIQLGSTWQRQQQSLSGQLTTATVEQSEQATMKQNVMTMLDALSKSGLLEWHNAQLHIIQGQSLSFGRTLMATLARDNINPIKDAESLSMIAASVIHRQSVASMLRTAARAPFLEAHPRLAEL